MATARQLRREAGWGAGVFECDRCHRILPTGQLDERIAAEDGVDLCKDRCTRLWSKVADELKLMEAQALTDTWEVVEDPPADVFSEQPVITGISPRPLQLAIGGSASTLELVGVNLSTDDVITYGHAGITTTTRVVNSLESVTLTISASGAVPAGDYAFIYNGTKFRKALRTR